MKSLSEMMTEWAKDGPIIRVDQLHTEMGNIPRLHSKYLNAWIASRAKVKALKFEYAEMKKLKVQYYQGKLNDPEVLKTHGWEPFPYKISWANKDDAEIYLDADKDLNEVGTRLFMAEQAEKFCDFVLKQIGNRTQQITGMINFIKYNRGQ